MRRRRRCKASGGKASGKQESWRWIPRSFPEDQSDPVSALLRPVTGSSSPVGRSADPRRDAALASASLQPPVPAPRRGPRLCSSPSAVLAAPRGYCACGAPPPGTPSAAGQPGGVARVLALCWAPAAWARGRGRPPPACFRSLCSCPRPGPGLSLRRGRSGDVGRWTPWKEPRGTTASPPAARATARARPQEERRLWSEAGTGATAGQAGASARVSEAKAR